MIFLKPLGHEKNNTYRATKKRYLQSHEKSAHVWRHIPLHIHDAQLPATKRWTQALEKMPTMQYLQSHEKSAQVWHNSQFSIPVINAQLAAPELAYAGFG
jgi:hypothetical protein